METKHWLVQGINEWKQLLGTWNWYTWTLIHIEIEKENMAYGYEFIIIVIGLGVRIRYNTDKSLEQFDVWEDESAEALIEHYSDTWSDLKDK